MEKLRLEAIPKQTLIVTIDENRYEIALKLVDGFMTYGIKRNGSIVIEDGARIVNGSAMFPYRYMESGNFILNMPDDELPDYEKFGATQFLLYFSQEELDDAR